LGKIGGRGSYSRIDPILFADGDEGKEALSHLRHMASAFNVAAERVSPRDLGAGRSGLVMRDAFVLHRPQLEPRLDAWLAASGVHRLDDRALPAIAADGSATLEGDAPLQFGQTVLVGDMALLPTLERQG